MATVCITDCQSGSPMEELNTNNNFNNANNNNNSNNNLLAVPQQGMSSARLRRNNSASRLSSLAAASWEVAAGEPDVASESTHILQSGGIVSSESTKINPEDCMEEDTYWEIIQMVLLEILAAIIIITVVPFVILIFSRKYIIKWMGFTLC